MISVFILLCLSVSGTTAVGQTKIVEIQDANGNFVQVQLPVQRIVVLTSDALEIVCALKADNLITGVFTGISREALFEAKLKQKPKVGDWREVNYELLAELKPDIVLCYARSPGKNLEKKLNPFGIKVIRLNFFKLETLDQEIKTLGLILGKAEQAEALINWHQNRLQFLQEKLKGIKNPPDIYIEGDSRYHTAGPGSGGDKMCTLAGGNNIAKNLSIPYPEITCEWILKNNPEVIIKVATRGSYNIKAKNIKTDIKSKTRLVALKTIQEEIMVRPAWNHIQAVKQKRVHVITNEIWAGPRAVIGASYLAKWFFPEKLKHFNPEEIHKEYINNFHNIKFQGKYAY
ncbi:ABC transporter substrate-binding protein [Desulfobacula sp.]|uniref:ABC transporter substrate-binding protein n=1 Tax=Desulfobacula sp. TaxID=2593537 RepID=UPI00260272B6|nr:ABC transporter substrate-binding protein [Desulfobacula sp.]